jgi:hypothetical protein
MSQRYVAGDELPHPVIPDMLEFVNQASSPATPVQGRHVYLKDGSMATLDTSSVVRRLGWSGEYEFVFFAQAAALVV